MTDPRDIDRTRIREAFVAIVEAEQPNLCDYLMGLLDAAFAASPYLAASEPPETENR